MKINKKILALTIIPFLFISCGKNKEEIQIEKIGVDKKIEKVVFQEFKEDIKYNKYKDILTIGKNVIIKKGGDNLPKYIKIYNN
ncbi:MAG: hypothetical protein Q9M94_05880, partial [Candidatus Gracilibacteria bacterium]|nr:hypothetical protein [Candidatus Gracilibacteria bacterium]